MLEYGRALYNNRYRKYEWKIRIQIWESIRAYRNENYYSWNQKVIIWLNNILDTAKERISEKEESKNLLVVQQRGTNKGKI